MTRAVPLRYAVLTPVRNEALRLQRLADAIAAQSIPPCEWVIIDHGSSDATPEIIARTASRLPYVTALAAPPHLPLGRGASVARMLQIAFDSLGSNPEIVVKVDADVTFGADHMERLLAHFAQDPTLGVASGTRLERTKRGWYVHRTTSFHVEGQCRAYRNQCFRDILPLEHRLGWDTVDLVRATQSGWRTLRVQGNLFAHHRPIGGRDNRRARAFFAEGAAAHHLGYRFDYLVLRTLFRMRREPVAATQVAGYVHAALSRAPRIADPDVVSIVREEQRIRRLPSRVKEACGDGGTQ